MQSRAPVAKVGRLRWGVSIARVHWCMNAAKSNASLDRQEGVGKVKPACRERAAVHRRQGATIPPSLPLSLFPFVFFCCCCIPLIYLFVCISSSLSLCCSFPFGAMEEATALTRYSGHKERTAEIKRQQGNIATQKILAYPWGIPTKLIPNEPNPSFFSIFSPPPPPPPPLFSLCQTSPKVSRCLTH